MGSAPTAPSPAVRCVNFLAVFFVAATLLVLAHQSPPDAIAQEIQSPSAADITAMSDPLDALSAISEHLGDTSVCLRPGNGGGGGAPIRTVATGVSLLVECTSESGGVRMHAYAEFPNVIFRVYRDPLVVVCPSEQPTDRCNPYRQLQHIFHFRADESFARRFTAAWLVLGQPRDVRDPATDTAFLALAAASANSASSETLRRVQVQAEAALRQNRNIAAARLYRDALRTAPGWADGHYNLGLLYGDLELFPEAITEMRRYLYLTPNGQDARAVQDKIYEWEAAMAEASQ